MAHRHDTVALVLSVVLCLRRAFATFHGILHGCENRVVLHCLLLIKHSLVQVAVDDPDPMILRSPFLHRS